MCLGTKNLGLSALFFGAGVILCSFLPSGIMVVIQAGVIIAAGIMILTGR